MANFSTAPFFSASDVGAVKFLNGTGRAKQSGEASRPMRSANEKLIVAQVDRVAPMKSSENDCIT